MNERMIELAKQANIFIGKDSYGIFAVIPGHEKGPLNRQGKAESYDALEKFAELIIKECVGMLDDEDDYGPYSTGVRSAAYRIKKRFGVEEEKVDKVEEECYNTHIDSNTLEHKMEVEPGTLYRVEITEYEAGWGQRTDRADTKYFTTYQEALAYKDHWEKGGDYELFWKAHITKIGA